MKRPSGERGEGRAITVAIIGGVFAVLATVIPLYLTGTIGGGGSKDASATTGPIPSGAFSIPAIVPPSFSEPKAASVFLSKVSAPAGATVLVSGQGFDGGEVVDIRVHTYAVASTKVNSTGSFANVTIVIPTQLQPFAPQQFSVVATGKDSAKSAETPIEIGG